MKSELVHFQLWDSAGISSDLKVSLRVHSTTADVSSPPKLANQIAKLVSMPHEPGPVTGPPVRPNCPLAAAMFSRRLRCCERCQSFLGRWKASILPTQVEH